jgi:hypothetical protein
MAAVKSHFERTVAALAKGHANVNAKGDEAEDTDDDDDSSVHADSVDDDDSSVHADSVDGEAADGNTADANEVGGEEAGEDEGDYCEGRKRPAKKNYTPPATRSKTTKGLESVIV